MSSTASFEWVNVTIIIHRLSLSAEGQSGWWMDGLSLNSPTPGSAVAIEWPFLWTISRKSGFGLCMHNNLGIICKMSINEKITNKKSQPTIIRKVVNNQ